MAKESANIVFIVTISSLARFAGDVLGLAVHGDRLFSASRDGTIQAWALGAWAALRSVQAYGRGSGQYPQCLAVSGSRLISGSAGSRGELRVWSLETLDLERALPQPAGAGVGSLLAVEEGLLAGVGMDVVVWGRGA